MCPSEGGHCASAVLCILAGPCLYECMSYDIGDDFRFIGLELWYGFTCIGTDINHPNFNVSAIDGGFLSWAKFWVEADGYQGGQS